ncbi:hypothetical protein BCO_0900034 (plasmid) [Borrelia coriaceae ATCC 43381]|uniref:Uncharacterized protein n=1 Tax=Borrelia coriaceae ATCC 43381 TaxID=1408429 RepID=W5T1L7_9SPIR|nr:hypothetical protein BCO_0900034 [Borrelia coriaceae ATCC 43381]
MDLKGFEAFVSPHTKVVCELARCLYRWQYQS